MFSLEGKTALITGATGGIGEEIARVYKKMGATVAISGTREEKLNAIAEDIGATPILCNLADLDSVTNLAKTAIEKLGKVDILVCNAGITADNLAMRMKTDEWQSVIDINLTANFKLIQGVMRGMMKNRTGRIVLISSIVGATGNAGQVNYAASKGGMVAMAKSLALEVASRGITVNCIAPGFILTPMTDKLNDEQKSAISAKIASGEFGTPSDIANGALYLASDEARYITGQTLHINGGMFMG